MKLFNVIIIASLIYSHNLFAETDHNKHQDHSKHNVAGKAAANKPEKKFVADEDLKKRMSAVLDVMLELHKSEGKDLKKEQLMAAGKKIESTVQDIFANCKLTPEADVAIHPILADILDGASLFKKNKAKDGHQKIHNALLKYEDFFDHAGWNHSKNE